MLDDHPADSALPPRLAELSEGREHQRPSAPTIIVIKLGQIEHQGKGPLGEDSLAHVESLARAHVVDQILWAEDSKGLNVWLVVDLFSAYLGCLALPVVRVTGLLPLKQSCLIFLEALEAFLQEPLERFRRLDWLAFGQHCRRSASIEEGHGWELRNAQ